MDPQRTPALTILSRRPAVMAAAALIAGILLHRTMPDLPWAWLCLAGIGAGAAIAANRFQSVASAALIMAIVAAGLALGQLHRYHFAPRHVGSFTGDAPALADLELIIDQPPRIITVPSRFSAGSEMRQITLARAARIRTTAGWADCAGEVTFSVSPPVPGLAYGQRVAALATLHRPAPAANPGQFDWSRYYRDQRVLASVHADAPAVRILSPGSFSWLQWLRARAREALARGFDDARALDHALLRALVLGDYDPQLRDVQDDFQRTGTSHHLAISGLHVAILGGLVFFFCRLIRLSPRAAAWTMIGFVLLYGLVALPSPPVVRSIVLCLCFGAGVLLKRAVDGVQLLAITVVAMLVYDPLDLYNPGFQLSFGTVLGLMIFATPLARGLHQPSEDERVLRSFGIEPSRAAGLWRWFRDSMIAALAAGAVAWAISAPLIIAHFDQLNPWAIPASILLAPAVFLSLVGGLFKILLTLLIPWAAQGWAQLAAMPVANMRWTVNQLARVPGSDLPLPALSSGVVAAYYAILALPMIPAGRTWLRRVFRGGAATAVLALLLLPMLIGFAPRRGGDLSVTLLSVGPGQCAVARLPSGRTVLIDAGSLAMPDLSRRCLGPFLRRHGLSRIDAVFISHANLDHFNAVPAIARAFGPMEVYIPASFDRHAKKNPAARSMLQSLAELKCPVTALRAGQRLQLDESSMIRALWPGDDPGLDANDSSLVLQLTCRGKSILFTGDIQQKAQEALVRMVSPLRSDVLVAPHHGSAVPTTARLLAGVGPRHILASSDAQLSARQKQFDALAAPRQVHRTAACGAITVRIDTGGRLTVTRYLRR